LKHFFESAERLLAILPLMAMVGLAVAEFLLRKFSEQSIPGALPLVQHLTLWAGFLGALYAARLGGLLRLGTEAFFPKSWQAPIDRIGRGVAAAVSLLLGSSSLELLRSERTSGGELLPGLPIWVALSVLPVAYFGLAFRLVVFPGGAWKGWLGASWGWLLGGLLAWNPEWVAGASWVWGVGVLMFAAVFGAPLFAVIGGSALWLFLSSEVPTAAIAAETYRLAVSPTLPAVPLFTLAGCLLAAGQSAARLLRLFQALVGWLSGGTALVVALLCAFFTALTGGSGVTILAAGALLYQALRARGYSDRFSIGLLTASGSLGLLFPPAVPLVLYGIVASQPIPELYLGGLLPGLLILLASMAFALREGRRVERDVRSFSPSELGAALRAAWGELLLPVVVLGLLFSGWATLLESAAIAALGAGVLVFGVYRDRKLWELPAVVLEATTLIGGILLILGVANGLASYLVDAQLPAQLTEWAAETLPSKGWFLLGLNALLLGVGCLMDIYSAIAVVVPLIIPMADRFLMDPIHLGIIFVTNLELGFLTPPVGINLFLAAYRFERSLGEVVRAVLPWIGLRAAFVLLVTYVPTLTLTLLR
jgi:tripartite ATP-independent transporter DctM subunit